MLLALSLRDFVIVEQLHLDFQSGFTVLTGETGAGKSITLDAIGLLLGDKADFGQIRNGAQEARLSALFNIAQLPDLQNQLYEQGLSEHNADELSIHRVIDIKGKSRSFINGQVVTLAQLKTIGSQLIDIHGQNTHHSLNKEHAQRVLLDAFSGSLDLLQQTQSAYQDWQHQLAILEHAKAQSAQFEIERERLEWQLNEFEQLNLEADEWQTLNQRYDTLAHAAELLQASEQTIEYIDGEEGIQSLLHRCQRTLQKLSDIEPRFAESLAMLATAEAEMSEVSHLVHKVIDKAQINPNELMAKEERMQELMSMARKYRIEPEQLSEKMFAIQTELSALESVANIDALEQAVIKAEATYMQFAQALSNKRQQAAKQLAKETTQYMQQLAMKGAVFAIELQPCKPTAFGLEQIQYQVSANKGNPLRPLNKVASGGELARISLALQVASSQYTSIPTLIFDEVDTGVGGSVAEIVGRALRTLGKTHQVIAVTHLPQVASYGQQHWQVAKHDTDKQTLSEIKVLNQKSRIEEIARMLGGELITDTTRQHAQEMLAMATKNEAA